MKYEQFSYSPYEYGAELTSQSHQTLYWLNRNGYLSNEDTEYLLKHMIVAPIKNSKKFGQRLLDRFFGRDTDENCYVFPITLLEEGTITQDSHDSNGEQKLKLVKK